MADKELADKERIGIVGVGRMGQAMTKHLIKHGYAVLAQDIEPKALEAARAAGAETAKTPAEVGKACKFVIVAVGYDDEAAAVILDSGGLLETMSAGSVIAVSSTCTPDHVKMLAERAGAKGVEVLDAPICRGQRAADDGTMLTLCGGKPDVFDRGKPIYGAFCQDIVHLGDIGAGQFGKAMNNFLLWVNGIALIEAGRLSEANGMDLVEAPRGPADELGRLRCPEELGERLVPVGAERHADRLQDGRQGRSRDADRRCRQGVGQGWPADQADEPAGLDRAQGEVMAHEMAHFPLRLPQRHAGSASATSHHSRRRVG